MISVLSSLDASDEAFDVSSAALMRELAHAEEHHFWHRARNEFIRSRLSRLGVRGGSTFLDIGCGGGCVAAHLSKTGLRVTGVDGHLVRIQAAQARAPRADFYVHDLTKGFDLLPSGFDAAGLFDVIEHLDEPEAALRGALSRVRPGGLVVGTVPALMALYSEYDVRSGHKLRYEVSTLRAMLMRTGDVAQIVDMEPFNRMLVLPMWVARKRKPLDAPLRVPAWPVNAAWLWLLRLEYALAARVRSLLPGASLWFALRRHE